LLLEDMSYKEIAEILDVSVSNVGVRVNRAKTQLKEILRYD
jgi:RNA polymerase sigma-70 factor (ECF subfamily)